MKTNFLHLRAGLAALLLTVSASAATFSLNPSEDTFVASAVPTGSYGTAGALAIAAGGLPKGEFNSLLKFDLAAAKASFDSTFGLGLWTIQSITLKLTNSSPNNALFNSPNASGQFTFTWMQNDAWVQGTGSPTTPGNDGINYNTLPTFLSAGDQTLGTYSYSAATTGSNTWTLGLTSGFVADVTAGNNVSLIARPAGTTIASVVNSLEFGTSTSRPLLEITVVPEPGAGMLLASAAVGWMARRRRHARAA